MQRQQVAFFVGRRCAFVHMLVPLRDAERNPLVEFIFAEAPRRRVHHTNQLAIILLLLIERAVGWSGLKRSKASARVSTHIAMDELHRHRDGHERRGSPFSPLGAHRGPTGLWVRYRRRCLRQNLRQAARTR